MFRSDSIYKAHGGLSSDNFLFFLPTLTFVSSAESNDIFSSTMSSQSSETQTTASAETKEGKKKIICGSCESELEPDHSGIQCVQGHHYCVECSKQIVSLFFADPTQYTPLRCVSCRVELNPSVFERQLNAQQLEFYQQHMLVLIWMKELLGLDERLDNCPFCSFAVIRGIYDDKILLCQHPTCLKASCLVCRKACPRFTNNYAREEESLEMIKHYRCAALADEKFAFDQAMEFGQKLPCPNCGLAGMKDDLCTHMTCPTCAQVWCYFCGKRVEDCDKEPNGGNGIYDHNRDWNRNKKRCPMYFTQIQDIDDRWPDDEEQCLIMFHRNRSLRLLRDLVLALGEERIRELNEHFNSLDSCGFTWDEITKEDLTLIQYGTRSRRRV